MDLDYLFSLLESKRYFVNRKCHFEDKGESVLPPKSLFGFNTFGIQLNKEELQTKSQEVSEKIQNYKDSAFWLTSCWTKDSTENLLMWKNYTTKIGVRIKSNINKFVASIDTDKYTIVCGVISYDGYTSKPFEECIFSKEQYYKNEDEVRFYFLESNKKTINGESIPVIPNTMIDEIIFSPYIHRKAAKKLAELIDKEYGINSVNQSKIELK